MRTQTLLILLTLTRPLAGAALDCRWSDVSGDGIVTVDELVVAINNAVNGCPSGHPCWGSATDHVTIADLLIIADEALNGCPAPFDPTPTPMPECASFTPVFHWIDCPTATPTLGKHELSHVLP